MGFGRKVIMLYIKVFLIIFFIGIFLPYIINHLINILTKNSILHNNSIYVLDYDIKRKNYFEILIKLFSKITDF